MLCGESRASGSEKVPGSRAERDLIQVELLSTRDETSGNNKSLCAKELMGVNCKVLPTPIFNWPIILCRYGRCVRGAGQVSPEIQGSQEGPQPGLPVVLSPLCSSWPSFPHRGLVFYVKRVVSARQFYNL